MAKKTESSEYVLYDASGSQVESFADSVAAPKAATMNAYVELRNGMVSFIIDLEVDPNTYPFQIVGGTIKSGICGAPWNVTGGRFGNDLYLEAVRKGQGSCAGSIIIVGERQDPDSWRGTYGFDGTSASFRHTTIFHRWSLSP
ncbi:hypothetical protein [Planobispora longispora]|uniref:Uncharacterized protein n=1 Tax=Planobispora longispora TaxID=28887 RepID=A0A8J3RH04_9ACTN|nr:hypothetical protein [Planobispora longispora]BFE87062.1 hypothetical protein GCM10020093_096630 [Planobispora longispora]GIH74714.1 hypothetical protein Plo01_11430 [Planobispora longispora]